MSTSRRPLAWLLALALIASQWLLSAHDARHLQAQPSKAHATCQLCLHHAAQDLIAGDAGTPAIERAPFADRSIAVVRAPAARQPRHQRARAPPAFLA